MSAAIGITRVDLTAVDLRRAAGKVRDSKAARRMLVIGLVLEGVDRTTAAATCGMDRQTLRDWVWRQPCRSVRHLGPAQFAATAV